MAAGAISNKPNLRGFHHATIKRNLLIMIACVFTAANTVYFTFTKPRKRRYADFYLTYDAEAAAERMRAAGVFQSAPPDPPADAKAKK